LVIEKNTADTSIGGSPESAPEKLDESDKMVTAEGQGIRRSKEHRVVGDDARGVMWPYFRPGGGGRSCAEEM
jgi:hypothetical protein